MTLALPTPEIIIGPMLSALDLFGIAVFATSGALAAARKEQTLVTFAFFALVTGVGGGTIRDLLINAPVFWIRDAVVPLVILIVVLLVWMTPQRWWKGKMLDWFDAAGLAAYSVFGAAKSLEYGVPPLPAAMMGVITACAGGIIRDVVAATPARQPRGAFPAATRQRRAAKRRPSPAANQKGRKSVSVRRSLASSA